MPIRTLVVIALAVAAAIAVFVFAIQPQQRPANPNAPNVKFAEFTPGMLEINVGQAAEMTFNVQNLEPRNITDARVVTVVEPSGAQQYLSVDRPAIDPPPLAGQDSRTGQMLVEVTAMGAPAKEAVYVVKSELYAEGVRTDVRQFELKVKQ